MRILLVLILSTLITSIKSQELPLGYISYFNSDFNSSKLSNDIFALKGSDITIESGIITLKEKTDTTYSFLPAASFFINNNIFGEYIVETKIKYTSEKSDSLSGIYILAAFRDSTNYYFIRLNSNGASFYRMYRGKLAVVDVDSTFLIHEGKWHALKIARDILNRSLTISNNDFSATFTDVNLVMGYFGLGTKNKTLLIDKITIWAPTSIDKPIPLKR